MKLTTVKSSDKDSVKTKKPWKLILLSCFISMMLLLFIIDITDALPENRTTDTEVDIQEYVKNVEEYILMSGESKTFDITLTEEIYGKDLTEFKQGLEVEDVSANIITDEKSFVTIIPMPDFLDNQSYYFEDGKLVAYRKDFIGIGGSVTYYFKDGQLVFTDETKIEEEMTFVSENADDILQRASEVYKRFCNL